MTEKKGKKKKEKRKKRNSSRNMNEEKTQKKREWRRDYAALRVHKCRNSAPYLIGIRGRARYFLVLFLQIRLDLAIFLTLLCMSRANSAPPAWYCSRSTRVPLLTSLCYSSRITAHIFDITFCYYWESMNRIVSMIITTGVCDLR